MSVPYDQNAQIITVTLPMSDGTNLAQLPIPGTTVSSDNTNVSAGIHNAGTREVFAKRLVAGPVAANITVTVNGVSSGPYPVAFDGVPVPTLVAVNLADNRTGNL
jgi:hypothetical protein